ncbi:MAG: hypothetical protein OXC30_06230 [Alphaproteobacteria bacterium]|nr:hypothetical protein [Alphaproteobacteria bacterium]
MASIIICTFIVREAKSADIEPCSVAYYLGTVRKNDDILLSFLNALRTPLNFLIEHKIRTDNLESKFRDLDLTRAQKYMKFQKSLYASAEKLLGEREGFLDARDVASAVFWREIEGRVTVKVADIPPNIKSASLFHSNYGEYSTALEPLQDLTRYFASFDRSQKRQQKCLDDFKKVITRDRKDKVSKTNKEKGREDLIVWSISLYKEYITDLREKMTQYSEVFTKTLECEAHFVAVARIMQEESKQSRPARCAIL